MRLRSKILAFALPLTLLPLFLTALAIYYLVIRSFQLQVAEEQNRLLAGAIVSIRREQETARRDVALIANLPAISDYLEALSRETPAPSAGVSSQETAVRATLQSFFDQRPYYLQLGLVDAQGQERIKLSRLPGPQSLRSIKHDELFRRTLIGGSANAPEIQMPAEPSSPGGFVTAFAHRIRREQFSGVVVLYLNMAVFERALRPLLPTQRLSTFLFDDRGTVFARSFAGAEEARLLERLHPAAEAAAVLAQPGLIGPEREVSGDRHRFLFSILPAEEYISFMEPTSGENWFLGVLRPAEVVLDQARTFQGVFFVILAGALGAVIWTATKYSRRVTQPLERMAEATEQVARGQFDIHIDVDTGDEVGELAAAVKRMAASLRQYQAELVRSAKLAAIGEMASEISHEIQNRISGLSLWIQYLDAEVESGDPKREYLEEMKQGLRSFAGLLDSLKQIYKTPNLQLSGADLNELVSEALHYIEQRVSERKIQVDSRLSPGPLEIRCDADKITSVILNLLVNATEAVKERGRILVETSELGDPQPAGEPAAGEPDDAWVKLSVTDNGCGIAEVDLPRIFYPFYSTKGAGSGLGLAIASNFVAAHAGKIEVESRVGQGTTFTVLLHRGLRTQEPIDSAATSPRSEANEPG